MPQPFAPIAIVGAGALMPGATELRGFWHNILAKKDLITEVPAAHWRLDDYYDADPKAPDKTYARRGAFLPEVPFDAMGWGVPPSIMPATDTSQLLALMVAKMVLADVGRGDADAVDVSRTSVILGVTGAQELLSSLVSRLQRPVWAKTLREMGMSEEQVTEACDRIAAHYVPWQEASFPGLLGNVVAGRIANRLNLGGTNCIVDAACASALSALHMAIQELQLGNSDMVVTGGVDTLNDIFMHMCFSKTPALSPTGDCRPFSDEADGTLLGEGIGMVAIKRLADAERDGDHVYAVIRGVGTSSDGRSKSVYAPVSEGQAKALARAYEVAGYDASTVELVEAHGTATKAGDLAELKGLRLVFDGKRGDEKQWIALGSIKSQIGHTKAAAGIAGLLKVVMALHHKILPPTIKVKRPATSGDFENSPFYVNTESRPWIHAPTSPRRASVSSFGFGGSNFHVTCEEYEGPAPRPTRHDVWPTDLAVFTGADTASVLAAIEAARAEPSVDLARRTQLGFDATSPIRVAVLLGTDPGKALDKASATVNKGAPTHKGGVWFTPGTDPGKVAFLFPGQGSQYLRMGEALAGTFDAARSAWDEAEALLTAEDRLSFVVWPRPKFDDAARHADEKRIVRTEWAQPAIGVASVATLRLLATLNLRPDVVGGHSFGELTALHAAGVMDYPTLVSAARKRGELMAEAASLPGAMAAVSAAPEAIRPHLRDGVVIANYNTPEQTVIAGETAAVEQVMAQLDGAGLRATRLSVATAFHSPVVAAAGASLAGWLASVPFAPATLPVYSNTTAAVHDYADLARQLGTHLENAVRFVEEIEAMYQDGVRTFIEVGPGSVLSGLVRRILDGRPISTFATDNKQGDGLTALLSALGHGAALGLPVQFAPLWAHREVAPPPAPPKMSVPISGTNYGRPWPTGPLAPEHSNSDWVKHPLQAVAPPAAEPPPVAAPIAPSVAAPPEPVVASSPSPAYVAAPPEASMPAPTDVNPWIGAFLESQRQAADVHDRFQRTLADTHLAFLRQQEDVSRGILGLLGGGVAAPAYVAPAYVAPVPVVPAAVAPVSAPMPKVVAPAVVAPRAAAVPAPVPVVETFVARPVSAAAPVDLLLAVVSDKTGYPREMLTLDMNLEADLGIDSIKRVEILSAVREQDPGLPELDAETLGTLKTLRQIVDTFAAAMPAGAPPPVAADARPAPTAAPVDLLLAVVADKTGYPREMLNLDMNLEADLGIDSIKRVEILSAVREQDPGLPELDAETLGTLKTLRQIVDTFAAAMPAAMPAAAPVPAAAARPVGTVAPVDLLLAVVADKTGYPREMLNLDMNLEADLGIDSIKRVEILSAVREQDPGLPELDAETLGTLKTLRQIVDTFASAMPAAAPVPTAVAIPAAVAAAPAGPARPVAAPMDLLLAVVADKTGYPREMLNLDMNLEADLGIDSIKRVEILSAVREQDPGLPELDAETLGTLKTLRQIVDTFASAMPGAAATVPAAEAAPTPAATPAAVADPIHRFELSAVPVSLGAPHPLGPVHIVGEPALAAALAEALVARGVPATPAAPDGTRGVVFLAGTGAETVKEAFLAAKRARLDAGGSFHTVSFLGGDFGLHGVTPTEALTGGLAGLTKTVALEHPEAHCGAFDTNPTLPNLVARLAEALTHRHPIELGIGTSGLVSLDSTVAPERGTVDGLPVGAADVIVVSGGARGVTAACVVDLARASKARFVLLGRSTIDAPESASVAAARDEMSLKKALFAENPGMKPAEMGRRAAAVLAAREARATVSAIEAAGGSVRYLALDVTDGAALTDALQTVRGTWGPITGIVHGAGVIHDKKLAEKTEAQWDAVWNTKVDGALALLAATRADPLRVIVFFSSVAGRAGNPGQCDYAAANEALNKLAAAERTLRPNAVVKAIGWGPWEGGMVTPALKAAFAARGVALIPLARGARIFTEELAWHPDAIEIVVGGSSSRIDGGTRPNGGSASRTFTARLYPFLRDHSIADAPVLPLAMALEWFVEVARALRPERTVASVNDLQVLKGIVFDGFDGAGDTLHVVHEDVGSDQVRLEIRSAKGVAHYRALVSFGSGTAKAPPAPSAGPLARYPLPLSEVYGRHLFHGPDFEAIRVLDGVSDMAAAAEVTGSEALGWPTADWAIDPAAFDGGLQLAVLWTRHHTQSAALPTRIDAYVPYGLPADGPVRVVLKGRKAGTRNSVSDISFIDHHGTLFAELRGVELHTLPSGKFPVRVAIAK